jgi:hypothetical protein
MNDGKRRQVRFQSSGFLAIRVHPFSRNSKGLKRLLQSRRRFRRAHQIAEYRYDEFRNKPLVSLVSK